MRGPLTGDDAASMRKKHARSAQLTDPIEQSRAVPIGDYGFLSDGEVSALVAPAGAVDWMCVPRFDARSVFGAILGQRAGSFRVAPSTPGSRPLAATCPGRWCSRRAGARPPAG